MTPKQFKVVIVLLVVLIGGQCIQTALLMRSAARVERSAASADMSAVDTMEITKEVRASLKPALLKRLFRSRSRSARGIDESPDRVME